MNVGMKHSNQKDDGQVLAGEKGRFIGWMTKLVYMDDSGHLYGSLGSSIWLTPVIYMDDPGHPIQRSLYYSFCDSCLLPQTKLSSPYINSPFCLLLLLFQLKVNSAVVSAVGSFVVFPDYRSTIGVQFSPFTLK